MNISQYIAIQFSCFVTPLTNIKNNFSIPFAIGVTNIELQMKFNLSYGVEELNEIQINLFIKIAVHCFMKMLFIL